MIAKQLKISILQMAVQGKLVPQNPNDEPASVLLEKIRAEKQLLIKEGKIKKDKQESIIFRDSNNLFYEKFSDGKGKCINDEIPFEIPMGWEIVRLTNIGLFRKGPFGSSLTKSIFISPNPSAIKVYEQKNAIQKDASLGTHYISNEYFQSHMIGFEAFPGDIIVSCAGTIGETYVMPKSMEKGIINQALMRIRLFEAISVDYFRL